MRHTHTYATMVVTAATYAEVAAQLRAAGYDHAFHDGLLLMDGIALVLPAAEAAAPPGELRGQARLWMERQGHRMSWWHQRAPHGVQVGDACALCLHEECQGALYADAERLLHPLPAAWPCTAVRPEARRIGPDDLRVPGTAQVTVYGVRLSTQPGLVVVQEAEMALDDARVLLTEGEPGQSVTLSVQRMALTDLEALPEHEGW